MKIALTGTPGVGKTSVAKLLGEATNIEVIDLNKLLLEKFKLMKDSLRDTWEIDIERAKKEIIFPKDCIIEGHLSHFFNVDWVVVLRCEPNTLEKRFKSKDWSKEKMNENFEAELLGIISEEARENNKRVYDIDTTKMTLKTVVKTIENELQKKSKNDSIDFLIM